MKLCPRNVGALPGLQAYRLTKGALLTYFIFTFRQYHVSQFLYSFCKKCDTLDAFKHNLSAQPVGQISYTASKFIDRGGGGDG